MKKYGEKEVIFLLVVTCIVSLYFGNKLNNKFLYCNNVEEDEYLIEFKKNYQYILDNYFADVDKEKIINGAIQGMVNSLDDEYSVSINDESSNEFNTTLSGNYSGIGIEIVNDENDNIIIRNVFEDSPAYKAGLKPFDRIIKIDDLDISIAATSELTNYIKTNEKKSYMIKVIRNGEELSFEIERELISLKSVTSKTIEQDEKKVGYIYISIFASNTASQFKTELEKLENEKIDSLIIDVRSNTGGHLATVEEIVSCFLDSSKLIYQIEDKNNIIKFYSKGKITKEYPIVILQNSLSASASELLSSALKESYGATIIGENSFGKGTVQELVTLKDGTQYKFTTKKWLTPNGNWIHKKGVEVDIEEKLSDDFYNNPDGIDNQLNTAISFLCEKN